MAGPVGQQQAEMKPHSQAPSLPREVPDLVGETLFLPFGNFQPEAGESQVFSDTWVRAPGSRSAPTQNRDTKALSTALCGAGGEYTPGTKVVRD